MRIFRFICTLKQYVKALQLEKKNHKSSFAFLLRFSCEFAVKDDGGNFRMQKYTENLKKCIQNGLFVHMQGPPNTFFWKMLKKNYSEYFFKFIFLFESTILSVNNGKFHSNSCLGWTCSSISPMGSWILFFKASIVLWLVGVTFIFDGTPQIIIQRCQIEVAKRHQLCGW